MDLILCRQRVHVNLNSWQTVKLFQPSVILVLGFINAPEYILVEGEGIYSLGNNGHDSQSQIMLKFENLRATGLCHHKILTCHPHSIDILMGFLLHSNPLSPSLSHWARFPLDFCLYEHQTPASMSLPGKTEYENMSWKGMLILTVVSKNSLPKNANSNIQVSHVMISHITQKKTWNKYGAWQPGFLFTFIVGWTISLNWGISQTKTQIKYWDTVVEI